MQGGTCRGRGAQERRLGWPHQPSVRRVRLPRLEAGLVKPTQPTVLAENARMNEDKGARPRAIAAQVLDAVLHRGRSLKVELAQALPARSEERRGGKGCGSKGSDRGWPSH